MLYYMSITVPELEIKVCCLPMADFEANRPKGRPMADFLKNRPKHDFPIH
jgi:hypothetical protein